MQENKQTGRELNWLAIMQTTTNQAEYFDIVPKSLVKIYVM